MIGNAQPVGAYPAALVLTALFFVSVLFEGVGRIVANRPLLFLGFVSYPLYLIHQNALVGLIARSSRHLRFVPAPLLPLGPILFLVAVAYVIARFVEPNAKKLLAPMLVGRKSAARASGKTATRRL